MKEAGEDPFLEGGARASERGGHPREGETAHAKRKKQEKKKVGERQGKSSPEQVPGGVISYHIENPLSKSS